MAAALFLRSESSRVFDSLSTADQIAFCSNSPLSQVAVNSKRPTSDSRTLLFHVHFKASGRLARLSKQRSGQPGALQAALVFGRRLSTPVEHVCRRRPSRGRGRRERWPGRERRRRREVTARDAPAGWRRDQAHVRGQTRHPLPCSTRREGKGRRRRRRRARRAPCGGRLGGLRRRWWLRRWPGLRRWRGLRHVWLGQREVGRQRQRRWWRRRHHLAERHRGRGHRRLWR